MKRLYKVTCSGKSSLSIINFEDIYVIAEDEKEAAEKALMKVKELKYDKVDDYVLSVVLIADEDESNKCLLII